MEKKIIIAPSLLAADFSILKEEITNIENAGAEYLHLDVMDGNFVPNISFGPVVIKSLRAHSNLIFDVHLMIENPDKYVADFVDAGADIICVHVESTKHLNRTIQLIKSYKKKVGVALNPSTSLDTIKYDLDNIDMVLIMTVNPGFGGQKFIPQMLQKIKELRKIAPNIDIQVDGGINDEISKLVIEAGANVLVAGSYVFNGNYKDKIDSLRP
ncbi:MAG: ribulose-phosphate 3-epimerase [Leptotrichiaceae bacterium]|jgi:ribulose-phosphate 3-epimerase|nr:ribulose-phosphate 3-epimerase [Leptotrichiaceae bacterium]MBP6167726.1 ribulose-phosphate 3-epimerase [Leptotrichiaceae bacterium]MBP7026021.1 ribulose-phosphate 3-epimerase [Leptotrichiaceae bacterium]MBP8637342.1 ribulose-phosphate 3-epimerase [Leptotrichiaceae bacterium]MBP9538618.1 ribulose-phosphate 3-epimerase [Leptotrichiaceae bacterium]